MMARGASVFLRTWGCTLNQSDSDIMAAIIEREGFSLVAREKDADVIVLNTCTVKGATENKIISELRGLRARNARIVVAGCLTASERRILDAAPDAVLMGPGAVSHIGEAVRAALECKNARFLVFESKFPLPRTITAPIARIPIQEGCIGKCAFCQTRIARPFLMSYPAKEVVRLVEEAAGKGANEIRLTGMDTGAYGLDMKSDLVSLLREVLKADGDFRMRLGMINPDHFKRMLFPLAGIFKSRKMFKFAHIPVQTGSERVCREMGRGHTVADFEECVRELRKTVPGITIATDIIVGYPTESDADFRLTLEMLQRVKPDVVNLSRFTPRPGTRAKLLKQLNSRIVKNRTVEAHALVKGIMEKNAQEFVGKEMEALMNEIGKKGQMKGRTENYRQVVVHGGQELMGKRAIAKVTKATHSSLFGEIVKRATRNQR